MISCESNDTQKTFLICHKEVIARFVVNYILHRVDVEEYLIDNYQGYSHIVKLDSSSNYAVDET